ncbi:FmdB family zinc ribbon protein [Prauserella endophytica]|uniref:FmdB family transcriptional regulator n=1 Tax=Prauserella endophytica TaxID=1592324 RepID=A0ABY2S159_9PSEU|nr:FmdB family zinc ribbon protein [Prauserella endophytica]TKG68321.1 FmdB family transcriptional regulator [Prauserella endophytica]
MPTYQYACKECGHQFEVVQSFSDASLSECPKCDGALRKLFGSVGVIFKGSGFYRNDSRSESRSSSSAGSTSNGSAKSSDGSGKSESSTSSSSSSDSSTSSASSSSATTTASSAAS